MGNETVCIRMLEPYNKVLSSTEAEELLERSALWEQDGMDNIEFAQLVDEANITPEVSSNDFVPIELPAVSEDGLEDAQPSTTPDRAQTSAPLSPLPPSTTPSSESSGTFGYSPEQERDIIGPDNRVRVSQPTKYPYYGVSQLLFKTPGEDGNHQCTAMIVAPHVALTAAHCVYRNGRLIKSGTLLPALSGTKAPVGSFGLCKAGINNGWTKGGCSKGNTIPGSCIGYDYAAVFFKKPFPATTYMPVYYSFNLKKGSYVNTAGYPGDHKNYMYTSSGKVLKQPDSSRVLLTDLDTIGGQSGSPIWIKSSSGSRRLIATASAASPRDTTGCRYVSQNSDLVQKWIKTNNPC